MSWSYAYMYNDPIVCEWLQKKKKKRKIKKIKSGDQVVKLLSEMKWFSYVQWHLSLLEHTLCRWITRHINIYTTCEKILKSKLILLTLHDCLTYQIHQRKCSTPVARFGHRCCCSLAHLSDGKSLYIQRVFQHRSGS